MTKPYTVILSGPGDDTTLTSHHVEGENVNDALREAMIEAEVSEVSDAVVLAGHHNDIRRTGGKLTLRAVTVAARR